jgi:hypothetical protein
MRWNRGVGRRQIFPGEQANLHFLELVGELPSRFGLRVHAYVLMGNHYHLQLEAPQVDLSRAMQWLNLSYGAWFNRRHERSGPLFQGRFKANAGGQLCVECRTGQAPLRGRCQAGSPVADEPLAPSAWSKGSNLNFLFC